MTHGSHDLREGRNVAAGVRLMTVLLRIAVGLGLSAWELARHVSPISAIGSNRLKPVHASNRQIPRLRDAIGTKGTRAARRDPLWPDFA
jgi:hypothetical protein